MGADVSVIIVCFNSRAMFARLKASLEAQTAPYDLWVIDNASAPDQRPCPEDFPAHAHITQSDENLGFAAANNRLVAQTRTHYVALLNPDAFPAPDWLERLLAGAARHPRAGALGSTQIMAKDTSRLDGVGDCLHPLGATWRGGHGARRDALAPLEGESFSVCAAAALYRRAAWDAVGGFDEGFFCFCEDVDLGLRLRLQGWSSVQIADAVAMHVGGGAASTDFAAFHSARNTLWMLAQSMPGALYWPLLPFHAALIAILYARSWFAPQGRAFRRGVRAGVAGLPARLRRRKSIQATRTVPSHAIARVLTWSLWAMRQRRAKILPHA